MVDWLDMLPPEMEPEQYRALHPDLSSLSHSDLERHYKLHGCAEGRRANGIEDRNGLVALIPPGAGVLEIGPFCHPMRSSPGTCYFDILDREGLIARAGAIGADAHGVPERIDYVSGTGDLSIIDRRFDIVISSHCLEHQPDLISHLNGVQRLLYQGGAYFLLLPDKRYCFDHFIPESNIADVAAAYFEHRQKPTLRSLIEHRALTTHNDSQRHWQGDHGCMLQDFGARLRGALDEFREAAGAYIDVHVWYFTPESIAAMMSALHLAGLIGLEVWRLYPTRFGANEFWMILRASG